MFINFNHISSYNMFSFIIMLHSNKSLFSTADLTLSAQCAWAHYSTTAPDIICMFLSDSGTTVLFFFFFFPPRFWVSKLVLIFLMPSTHQVMLLTGQSVTCSLLKSIFGLTDLTWNPDLTDTKTIPSIRQHHLMENPKN